MIRRVILALILVSAQSTFAVNWEEVIRPRPGNSVTFRNASFDTKYTSFVVELTTDSLLTLTLRYRGNFEWCTSVYGGVTRENLNKLYANARNAEPYLPDFRETAWVRLSNPVVP